MSVYQMAHVIGIADFLVHYSDVIWLIDHSTIRQTLTIRILEQAAIQITHFTLKNMITSYRNTSQLALMTNIRSLQLSLNLRDMFV